MNNFGLKSIKHKQTSSEALWERIEESYGVVPEMIKKILQVNGFDSYLALKGIRYDDKNDFFKSLESTIIDIVTSSDDPDREALEEILHGYCDLKKFKLKPGHRNFIMNLMIEIDNSDVNEFFKNVHEVDVNEIIKEPEKSPTSAIKVKYEVTQNEEPEMMEDDQYAYDGEEQVFVHEQMSEEMVEVCEAEEEEFVLEEYVSEENVSTSSKPYTVDPYRIVERKRKGSSTKRVHKKPDRMYNEDFLASNSNPRRRRVTSSKIYPHTDLGTRNRFKDLVTQSMECILSKEQLALYQHNEIDIYKQSDSCWIVVCPICRNQIKLAVVSENNGRYVNYKRSNFERHLRFKHCKVPNLKHLRHSPSSPSSFTNVSSKFRPGTSFSIVNN